jgi:hypothetical protein
MKQYNRVVGSFARKAEKLEKIHDKNTSKVERLVAKADRVKAKVDAKIAKLYVKNIELDAEAAACKNTAKKISDLLS